MPPLKSPRSASRRAGLPKQPASESQPPAHENGALTELPSDLSALAVILESAMASGTPATPVARNEPGEVDRQPPTSTPDVEADDLLLDAPDEEEERPRVALHATVAEPALRPQETTDREAAAFDEVARSLAAAEACVPLLAQSTGLMRIAALDVVKAETARAGGLLQLLRFLRGDISLPMTAVSTAAVIQRVAQAAEAERRLRGIALTSRSNIADATCVGDETLLTNTLLALLLITFGLIEGVQNARVTLSVTVNEAGELGLAVSQDHVPAPAAWTMRTPSEELPPNAGLVVAAISISAAHRLAKEWRGRFAVASGEHSSILTLWLPTTLRSDDLEPLAH
ncbi:MAG TPA: hypothetical protein VM819_11575 [Vicinamibacterales bacterium]|nr:hypothetical protein [Vicinamibacterales bacterium]